MAGGYIIDPQTGQPGVPTASGGFLPLPMSADQLSAAGLAPGLPIAPDAGPDQRLASNDLDLRQLHPRLIRQDSPAPSAGDGIPRIQLSSPNAPPVWQSEQPQSPASPISMPTREQDIAEQRRGMASGSTVRPEDLARPTSGTAATQGQGRRGLSYGSGSLDDPLVRQAMAEAVRGGGGGGPRQLGVTGQTEKFTTFQNPGGDPAAMAEAQEALGASDKYGEELAKSLNIRQQQAYEAQQAEFAARSGQLAAQQQRFEQQQNALQDYRAKREALMQEAAQLKTPQMEDYWGSRSTFANVMTGLSIVLGGALQGLQGGQNQGLEMSNQSIDRWVAAQQEAYRRAEGRVTDADNQYAKMMQAFGNENLAASHLREQAWAVRDGLLQSYAQKIGTPSALEAYNQAMLQTEAQRAALKAQNSQGAAVDIEQKLSMQGGAGGGGGVLKMLRAGAEAKELKDKITGNNANPNRPIDSEKTGALSAALDTVQAADEIKGHVTAMGYADSDTDDPRSGAIDYVKNNIPGTELRRRGQDLDQATFALARGAQQFLGKSDNDATLAEKQAKGLGGSGRERIQAAERLRQKAISKAKIELSSMTPDQRNAFIQNLAPDQRAIIQGMVQTDVRPASSAQEVQ